MSTRSRAFHFDESVPVVYFYPDGANRGAFYRLEWSHFVEMKEMEIMQSALFSSNFTYSRPQNSTEKNNFIQSTNMTNWISTENDSIVKVVLEHNLYEFATVLNVSGDLMSITDAGMLFSLDIEGWPFRDPSSVLEVHFKLSSTGLNSTDLTDHRLRYWRSPEDRLEIDFFPACIADSHKRASHIYCKSYLENDLPVECAMAFPHFTSIHYSAVVVLFDSTNTMNDILLLSLIVFGSIMLLIGLSTAVVMWKRYNLRSHYIQYD
eukprot:TRINITY_DN15122_c0_g1_i1.p1 TRINITY_DN15122_c0_g1~~TRINITY_DN15122_c0_g1_i1.p1  ORF type:complete len:286 (-),score=45.94 TRINITY_DN15122_c0_g1_i1:68-859(-)